MVIIRSCNFTCAVISFPLALIATPAKKQAISIDCTRNIDD